MRRLTNFSNLLASVKIAKELVRLGWSPDALYSIDSERTKETWKRMSKHIEGVEE